MDAALSPDRFQQDLCTEMPVLLRVALRLTLDPVEAEDLVMQTMYRAIRAKDSFDGTFLRSWLVRIMKNEFIAACRSHRAHAKPIELEMLPIEPGAESEELSEAEFQMDLLAALDRIPEDYRLPIVLCDIEELSYEDAASALEIEVGTLRTRLHRARRMLRQRLLMEGL